MFFVSADKSTPTLSDVIVFLTGCDCVPPLGFSDVSPAVMFSDDTGALPSVDLQPDTDIANDLSNRYPVVQGEDGLCNSWISGLFWVSVTFHHKLS